jgi:fructuronate reductase
MKLNQQGLQDKKIWEQKGYQLPQFDHAQMCQETVQNPFWIHFGAGNIFRAFQANVVQNLLNQGILNRGLIVAEGFDYEIVEKMYRPHDNYSILVTLKSDGSMDKTVIGSIAESVLLDSSDDAEFGRMQEIFRMSSLQMASFTITEKGYCLSDARGELLTSVALDMKNGPEKPVSYIGKVVALLYARYLAGQKPLAMVSMDNCSHNGDKLRDAVFAFTDAWIRQNLVPSSFAEYIHNPGTISFPWTMIDKITPRPDPAVEALLAKDGLEDSAPVITSKRTYVAPFVNSEECEYLVVEDSFPNGRPALEKGGLIFTDRETVDKVEKMKVCTCLNPIHTALAVFGCLLGYDLISREMKDPDLQKLACGIGSVEGLPVVVNPGILDPKQFLDTVLKVRIPNPFMPDTPQRIATDTSQKLSVRYGETIKAYMRSDSLHVSDLRLIPLVFAAWLRYLMGTTDEGKAFTLSPDPLLESLCPVITSIHPATPEEAFALLKPILENDRIFGVSLTDAGMSMTVCDDFVRMLDGPGSVRRTLQKVLEEVSCS